MIRFLFGVIFGIVIATIGVSGLSGMVDAQVENFKSTIKETAK